MIKSCCNLPKGCHRPLKIKPACNKVWYISFWDVLYSLKADRQNERQRCSVTDKWIFRKANVVEHNRQIMPFHDLLSYSSEIRSSTQLQTASQIISSDSHQTRLLTAVSIETAWCTTTPNVFDHKVTTPQEIRSKQLISHWFKIYIGRWWSLAFRNTVYWCRLKNESKRECKRGLGWYFTEAKKKTNLLMLFMQK